MPGPPKHPPGPGNVAFYEHRGYRVVELKRYTGKIVLAQMSRTPDTTKSDESP
ncbi:MAG: hypothetical protein IPL06_12280 [Betaproteobacteria bacterium]|nr:hypothetical protein [Betaproteobacteria bacterium]